MTDANNTLSFASIGPGPEYKSIHIWMPQLAAESALRREALIEGRTFTDCVFEGPAVLLPVGGCQFQDCNMGDSMGDARNLMLLPMGPERVAGAIAFKDCVFVNCAFMRIGFTGAPEFLEQLVTMLDGPK